MKIEGDIQLLWRAVDHDGEVLDVFVQACRDGKAAQRFFTRLLKRHADEPRALSSESREHRSQLYLLAVLGQARDADALNISP